VGKGDVEVVVSHDMIGRMMLLAARSPWLAAVLDNMMGFEGSELYLREWPALAGERFGAALYRFDAAVPVGLKRAADGRIVINPPDALVIAPGDELLLLAEDDNSYTLNGPEAQRRYYAAGGGLPEDDDALLRAAAAAEPEKPPERMLFCGWRRDMADMIPELDHDVPFGSELWLFNRWAAVWI
jgi:hypothetical protein